MKYARVLDNTIYDICPGDPSEYYHPDVAQLYTEEVEDYVLVGAQYNGTDWVNPIPTEKLKAILAMPVNVSPVEFMLFFTSAERVTLKAARNTDAVVDDFFDILEDQRLTEINMGLPSTSEILDYFISQGYLDSSRKSEILLGFKQ